MFIKFSIKLLYKDEINPINGAKTELQEVFKILVELDYNCVTEIEMKRDLRRENNL